ncbi:phospholipase D family protein [Ferrimonas marina]|uniref:Phosphatidylserine/phosphatidylglycerophosphate/cardiolipin synthase n=1 Tax=Ferrimonas marina TaxID=299255 RepID=A0A1M5RG91_9GAMM|nr:phospholipase D family protein [Ferrimonas marina]SHH25281.1 Phosphatidylserine/phosphatidylglycerophosphate/cardiolipin synthase [Ferrimonas marina]
MLQKRHGLRRWALGLALVVLGGCASLPTDFEKTPSHALIEVEDTRLGRQTQALALAHPSESGFFVLNDGLDAFIARYALINQADKSLDLQYYIWHDDLTGRLLHNRLLHAAERGVRVRLLLDDLDTAGKESILALLDAHPNLEVRLFNPFASRNSRMTEFVTDLGRVNHRMHNKSLTADNQATILGGRNIGDEYFDATKDVAFGDVDVLAIGPVVSEVSQSFDLYWNSEHSYPLSAFREGEPPSEGELAAFIRMSDEHHQAAEGSAYAQALEDSEVVATGAINQLPFDWSPWRLVYDDPAKVGTSKLDADTHMAPALLQMFAQTEQDLIVISPYFVPGDKLTEYFGTMVERGIRVRILTNALSANDVPLVHAGYMRYRKDLIRNGIELYEFKAIKEPDDAPKKPKKSRWSGASRSSLHAKVFGFDQRYLFVGSFNVDARSTILNTEIGVLFASDAEGQRFSDNFDRNALLKAYRVELDEQEKLVWITEHDGEGVVLDKEPETSWWMRFKARLMSIFVLESQL